MRCPHPEHRRQQARPLDLLPARQSVGRHEGADAEAELPGHHEQDWKLRERLKVCGPDQRPNQVGVQPSGLLHR